MKKTTQTTPLPAQEVKINGHAYWYNKDNRTLFYDLQMTKPTPENFMTADEYHSFLKQISGTTTQEVQKQFSIKNIDKNQWVKDEKNGKVTQTTKGSDRLIFYEEYEANAIMEMLNEREQDCFTLIDETQEVQKHTPGPWVIKGTSKSLQRYHVSGANGENLCAVFTSIPECEANAKLIASAPQLKAENEQLKASNKELRDMLRKLKTIFYNIRNGLDKISEIDVQAFIDKALQKTK